MSKMKTTDTFKEEIELKYPGKYTILGNYNGWRNPVKIKYNKCGHIRDTVADKIYKGKNCPVCYGGILLSQDEFERQAKEMNPHLIIKGKYTKGKDPIEIYCTLCGGTSYPHADELRHYKMSGCAVCNGKRVQIGINDMWTTNPKIAKLLADPEDGYKYTGKSDKYVNFMCPVCKSILRRRITTVNENGLCCPHCSKKVSYPERFMVSFLNQLHIEYKTQKIFEWSKNIKHKNKRLCGNKKYDFYVENKIIIETHGKQHYYEGNFTHKGARTLQEEQENDKLKEEIAKKNGINHYIVIDCRESNIEWIKNSILNSELNNLYNLSDIDWEECNRYATGSKIEEAAKLWNDGLSTGDIKDKMHISCTTVITYLNKAVELNMCNYNKKESRKRGTLKKLSNQTDKTKN